MKHRHLNHMVNMLLLMSGLVVMATGLTLFFGFHVGHGAHATALAGWSKSWWCNIHRTAALIMFPTMVAHLWLHWACIRGMLRGFRRNAADAIRHRLRHQGPLLVLSMVVPVTGFIAWMAFPHHIETLRHARHTWIDVHNIAGLILLVGLAVHTCHRWRRLWTG